MEEESKIKPGIYEHWKGKRYLVFFTARSSENPDEQLVVYESLYATEFGPNTKWVRPLEMFCEEVEKPDGTKVPRFKYLGPNNKSG